MKNTYNKKYIFDCQEIDMASNIIKRKMQSKYDVTTIIKDDTLLVKPNYRYTFFCPIEISTVAFCGKLICENNKVILYGKYKFNYLPFIVLSVLLLSFLMSGCAAYYFSNNISAIIFLGVVFFLASIFILSMYITIKFDYKILKESMQSLNIYRI